MSGLSKRERVPIIAEKIKLSINFVVKDIFVGEIEDKLILALFPKMTDEPKTFHAN